MYMEDHNNWITNRYFQLLADGQTDLSLRTRQVLKEQGAQCPVDNDDEGTPGMR